MFYIGRASTSGNYYKLDDISSQFNGSTVTFNLTYGGAAFYPASAYSILVSVGGVLQEPITSYTVNSNQITFASAPTTGSKFFCVPLGISQSVGVPGDATVTTVKIADGSITGAKLSSAINYTGTLNVSGVSTVSGVTISSGIITATTGVATYYGDGSKLTGIVTSIVAGTNVTISGSTGQVTINASGGSSFSISTNTTNQNQFIGFSTIFGTATGLGATSLFVFNPSTGNLGIGTATPTSTLHVAGNALITGVGTITSFNATTSTITNENGTNLNFIGVGTITNATGTNLNFAGIATASQLDLTANATANDSVLFLSGSPSGASGSNGLLGIGTINFTDTDIVASLTHNVNSYAQVILQNKNSGTSASSDFIVNNDRTAGTTYYGDFGINGTTFAGGGPFQDPDGTYLYSSGGTLSIGSNDAQTFRIATGSASATPVTRMTILGGASTLIGIGSTTPTVTLDIVGNAKLTGVITATTFSGNATSATYASTAGIATYATTAGVSTSVIGGIGSITQLQVTGVSTFTNGPVLIGGGTSTGTANQILQVTGISSGVYIGGSVGIGTTNPGATLNVVPSSTSIAGLFSGTTSSDLVRITQLGTGNALVVEDSTNPDATPFVVNTSGSVGIGTINPGYKLDVAGTINSTKLEFSNGGYLMSTGFGGTKGDASIQVQFDSTTPYIILNARSIPFSNNWNSITLDSNGFYPSEGTINLGRPITANTWNNAYFNGSIGIGTTVPSQSLHVQGNARVTGAIYDSTNSPGTSGQVLQSTVTGTQWTTAAAGGGGSGKFDTTIDNVLYIQPTGTLDIVGVGTTVTQITTLPAGTTKYIVHSLHVTNISNGDAEITAGFVMNARKVPASISVSAGYSGGAGIHTFTVGSASSITVGMAVTGTGNIGETIGIGSTAGFQFNTYVTSVDGNNITLSKPMSGYATGILYFSPVSKVSSRLPVPVGSAVELLKQPMVLNALDSIVLQSTGAGSGIGSTSTNAVSQTANSNTLTVTAGAAITNFLTSGMLIQGTGSNTGIQTNTYVGVGYIPGSLSIPMTKPATTSIASTSISFTEVVVPEDGALQVTAVYQSSTDTAYNNGTGTVVGIVTLASLASSALLGITSTSPSVYYATGNTYPSIIQSIRVTNISDSAIYPGGDYPVSVGIGNSDTVFSWLAYNMVIPKNSSIELCEAPKRIGIGQSIFASSPVPGVIEIQVAGKQKTS